jgi:hypothetical protein
MGLFGGKKNVKDVFDRELTSFEFVQHLIKYPNESDERIIKMYHNLVGGDNLQKEMEDYWRKILEDSFIDQEEFERIKEEFSQKFKRIRLLANKE